MILMTRACAVTLALLFTSGCWNGGNDNINFGTVSIGQQMIDLKAALEQDAITPEEYDRLKTALMTIDGMCGAGDDE